MYEKDGEKYYVVDGHMHFWDASPENTLNRQGEGFIETFYAYHANLSPPEYVWPYDKYRKYSEEDLMKDLFEDGYVDKAIFLPTYLTDWYKDGFNTTARDAILAEKYPDKFILNSAWDARDGQKGLDEFEAKVKKWGIKGVKLYTAEWKGESRGYSLASDEAYQYLAKCEELGVTNIHVHKGPTIWPMDRDAFDVADIDHCATDFPNLTFIVEHVGLPRLEDFCWIATQEPNVCGGLAVAIPFMHTRPRFFAKVIGELLFWIGPDRVSFASDYALWHPKWLVERFVDFQIPEDMQEEYGQISTETKKKILGLNLARLYNIDVPDDVKVAEAASV